MITGSEAFHLLFENPVAASGSMGILGDGWTPLHRLYYGIVPMIPVLKTVTLEPREGNSFRRAWRRIPGGCVNALSLGNRGLDHLLGVLQTRMNRPSVISLFAANPEEMSTIVERVAASEEQFPWILRDIVAFEIDLSCPNHSQANDMEGVLAASGDLPRPVVAKVGAEVLEGRAAIAAAHAGHIAAVSGINSVRWEGIFPRQISPLVKSVGMSGGVSGRPIKTLSLQIIRHLREELPKGFPILGIGGIQDYDDLIDLHEAGATGFELGTVLTQFPLLAIKLLKRIAREGQPGRGVMQL
jgi:dihydroorotate dehydrogenase (NAD+) catalytic subunit